MSRPPRAFSIAELVVVLTVMGLLLMLAASRFSAFRDATAVHAAAAEARHTFATARELAVTRRAATTVRLDSLLGTIEVWSAGGLLVHRDLRGSFQVALVANRDSMVYDPRGLGFGASNLSLVLRRGGSAETLAVSRLGRVR